MARPDRQRTTGRADRRPARFGIDGAPEASPAEGGASPQGGGSSPQAPSAAGSTAPSTDRPAGAAAATPGDAYRPPPQAPEVGRGAAKPRRRRRVVPTLTFLLGLALGAAAVVGLVQAGLVGGQGSEASPAPEPSPTGLVLTVPESCSQAGALSTRVIGITEEVVVSTRDFDPRRLEDLVDQLQQLDPQVRAAVAACNEESRDATIR